MKKDFDHTTIHRGYNSVTDMLLVVKDIVLPVDWSDSSSSIEMLRSRNLLWTEKDRHRGDDGVIELLPSMRTTVAMVGLIAGSS
ncbi:hypothetical protein NL676_008030 [Syzygium grande]|nr:hypothetical protein NL676_008030 [Syzygium grande]